MTIEENIGNYIRKKGISLQKICEKTGLAYMPIYNSLYNQKRHRLLRSNELLLICDFLDKSPEDFINKKKLPEIPL